MPLTRIRPAICKVRFAFGWGVPAGAEITFFWGADDIKEIGRADWWMGVCDMDKTPARPGVGVSVFIYLFSCRRVKISPLESPMVPVDGIMYLLGGGEGVYGGGVRMYVST